MSLMTPDMKRINWQSLSKIFVPVLGVSLGVLLGALLVVPEGESVFTVLKLLVSGAFGSVDNISESLIYAVPLGLTGLAIAFSYSTGVFNIGCEGQLQLGAAAATLVATSTAFGSPFVHIALAILAGAAMGSFWAFIPGVLRAYNRPCTEQKVM